jgi:hypothetical protein
MLRIGDPVWHRQYGSGHLAKTSGADHWVIFDNPAHNIIVSTEGPPTEKYFDKISGEEKTRVIGPAPLDGKVVYWDKPVSDMPEEKKKSLTKEQEPFRYPKQPGYYTVLKVGPAFRMKYNEQKKKLMFFPSKGEVDMRLENTGTGEKFKVRIDNSVDPAFPTARRITSGSITGLVEGDDVLW